MTTIRNMENGTTNDLHVILGAGLSGESYFVQAPGMFHVNFTDAPSYTPLAHQLGFAGTINTQRAYNIVNPYALAFFD